VLEKINNSELSQLYESRLLERPVPVEEAESPIRHYEMALWWSKDQQQNIAILDRGSLGMPVQVFRGNNKLILQLRNNPEISEKGYIRIILASDSKSRVIGEVFVEHWDFKDHALEFNSSGGKRWLQVDLMNGKAVKGPVIELGSVTIEKVS
jgi:hypothetical protein